MASASSHLEDYLQLRGDALWVWRANFILKRVGRDLEKSMSLRALISLRDPYDAIMDQHIGLGLQDDCEVIRSTAQLLAGTDGAATSLVAERLPTPH